VKKVAAHTVGISILAFLSLVPVLDLVLLNELEDTPLVDEGDALAVVLVVLIRGPPASRYQFTAGSSIHSPTVIDFGRLFVTI
jgi:hypothetical protein